MYCIYAFHFKCKFKMTLSTLHIDNICTVCISKVSFAVMSCLVRQFIK